MGKIEKGGGKVLGRKSPPYRAKMATRLTVVFIVLEASWARLGGHLPASGLAAGGVLGPPWLLGAWGGQKIVEQVFDSLFPAS